MDALYSRLHSSYGNWWWVADESLQTASHLLRRDGFVVLDNFLGQEEFAKVLNDVKAARDKGLMSIEGKIGGGREGDVNQSSVDVEVRNDILGWLDCSMKPASSTLACHFEDDSSVKKEQTALTYLVQRMETLVMEMKPHCSNEKELSGVNSRSRVMCTCYPATSTGSRYTAHVDNANHNGRRITAIYYLNKDYHSSHGGSLRIHHNLSLLTSSVFEAKQDITPVADRLVLFWSDMRTPHEVMPSYQDRYAVTVWFFDALERRTALESQNTKDVAQVQVDNIGKQNNHKGAGLGDLLALD